MIYYDYYIVALNKCNATKITQTVNAVKQNVAIVYSYCITYC